MRIAAEAGIAPKVYYVDEAAERRDRDRAALILLEPWCECRRHCRCGETGPAKPHHEEGDIYLPKFIRVPNPDNAAGHGGRSQRDHGTWSKATDRATDRDQQERATT